MCLGERSRCLGTSGFPEGSADPLLSDCCRRRASTQGVRTRIDVSSRNTPSVRCAVLAWKSRRANAVAGSIGKLDFAQLHGDTRLTRRSTVLATSPMLGGEAEVVEFRRGRSDVLGPCRTSVLACIGVQCTNPNGPITYATLMPCSKSLLYQKSILRKYGQVDRAWTRCALLANHESGALAHHFDHYLHPARPK